VLITMLHTSMFMNAFSLTRSFHRPYKRNQCRVDAFEKQNDNKQIFQFDNAQHDISIDDVNYAFKISKGLHMEDRRNFFASQGINYDNACKYLNIIRRLDNSYKTKV
jgi:hypothetical protein